MISKAFLKSLFFTVLRLSIAGLILLVLLYLVIAFSRREIYKVTIPGKLFAVNKIDRSITVFDLEMGKEIRTIPLGTEPREIVALADEKHLVFTNHGDNYLPGKSVSIIDSETLEIKDKVFLPEGSRPYGVVALEDLNKVVSVTNGENKLLIIDTERDSVETIISINQKISQLLVLHPQKPIAYVTNKGSGSVSVIDYENRKVIKHIKTGSGTEGIDITPDGEEVWVTNALSNTISIIDTHSNTVIDMLEAGNESYRVKFTLDGELALVTSARDGSISVYDRHSKHLLKRIVLNGLSSIYQRVLYHSPHPVGIFMHPDGDYAFIANSNADKIEILDLHSLEIVSNINTGRVPDGIAFIR